MSALKQFPPVTVAKTFSQMLETFAANNNEIPSALERMFHNASPKTQEVILEDIRKRLERENNPVLHLIKNSKIPVEFVGTLEPPSFTRMLFRLTDVSKAKQLMGMGLQFQLELGLAAPPLIAPYKGAIAIDIPREERRIAHFRDYWTKGKLLDFSAGVNAENKLVRGNLGEPETCHAIGAGATGSGKSIVLRTLLTSLLQGWGSEEIKILICDCKLVTFTPFEGLPHLLAEIITQADVFVYWLEMMEKEMERRYELFKTNRVQNITEYVAKTGNKMPPYVIFCDEYGVLKEQAVKDTAAQMDRLIAILGAKARAAGIHLVLFSQRALNVFTPNIRNNLPAWILLYVKEQADLAESFSVTGSKGFDGSKLLGRGDMYFMGERVQALLPDDDDFHSLWS